MKVPNWLEVAWSQRGQHEVRGGENPKILEYLRATDIGAPYNREDETPWCSAFVNWCMQRVGFKGTRSAAALSWKDWGKDVWDELPVGAIVVMTRNQGGHVGFLWKSDEDGVTLLAGNQSDSVNTTWFPWDNVVGVRWPAYTQVAMVDLEEA